MDAFSLYRSTELRDADSSSVGCFVGKNNQPECHRHPGFEGVPVALHVASCIAFFELISFVGSQGGSKEYV